MNKFDNVRGSFKAYYNDAFIKTFNCQIGVSYVLIDGSFKRDARITAIVDLIDDLMNCLESLPMFGRKLK